MIFKEFSKSIADKYKEMESQSTLYVVDVSKEELWETYLDSFPEEENRPLFENREYDCNTCKKFIKAVANVVAIVDGKVTTVWDVEADGYYKEVVNTMRMLVESREIVNKFLIRPNIVSNNMIGIITNTVQEDNITVYRDKVGMTFHHLHATISNELIKEEAPTILSKVHSKYVSYKRSCEDISLTAIEIVKDLIDGDLYRGAEMLPAVVEFEKLLIGYHDAEDKNIYLWSTLDGQHRKIRSTVIGTLLLDVMTEDLDVSVKKFEDKVAPSNYKRTNAVVTPRMREQHLKIIQEAGIEESLYKRYAILPDVSVNDVLFVDSNVSSKMQDGIAGMLAKAVPNVPKLDSKVTRMSLGEFISTVVPNATEINLLLENKHIGNLVSLIAPQVPDAKNIHSWDNNFSWAYNGGVTDSMRQRVSAAGGRVDGVFRFTHSWNEIEPNRSLMDLHVFMPGCELPKEGSGGPHVVGRRVGWNNRRDVQSKGVQDVDYTNPAPSGYVPIENITFPDLSLMPEGVYTLMVHNWDFRGTGGQGSAEVEFEDTIYQYTYPRTKHYEWVTVAEVTLKDRKFTIKHFLDPTPSSKTIWNVKTQELIKVDSIMYSPNYWGNNEVGNKHTFFMLEGCKNPDKIRGLYNEHLSPEYREIRKSIDLLAPMLMCEPSDNQISGIGISSTKKDEFTFVVRGNKIGGTFVIST